MDAPDYPIASIVVAVLLGIIVLYVIWEAVRPEPAPVQTDDEQNE